MLSALSLHSSVFSSISLAGLFFYKNIHTTESRRQNRREPGEFIIDSLFFNSTCRAPCCVFSNHKTRPYERIFLPVVSLPTPHTRSKEQLLEVALMVMMMQDSPNFGDREGSGEVEVGDELMLEC